MTRRLGGAIKRAARQQRTTQDKTRLGQKVRRAAKRAKIYGRIKSIRTRRS